MKNYLFFFLALISFSVHARANWNPYNMNHERFVHLSEDDKRAVIISTMELMVELESKYQKEIVSSGFSTERLQKYVKVLQKFQNLILGNAYADTTATLTGLAGQFAELLKTLGSEGCIYGGYVSKMGLSNGKKFCRHPSTMRTSDPKEAAIKKAYLTSKSCIVPSNISCNPVVFGYQDVAGTTPICVQTTNTVKPHGHNVSYECMKKALAEPNKDERLAVVTKAMAENKDAFNKVHSFIFRTCACKDDTGINKAYAAYIKPHRTCYGMINTLRALNTDECGQLTKIVPEADFASDWAKYFGSAAVFPTLEPDRSATYDTVFGGLMSKPAVQAICDGVTTTPEVPVVVTPEEPVVVVDPPKEDKKSWLCKTTCKTQEIVPPATAGKILCSITQAGWEVIKAGTTEAVFTDAAAELSSLEFEVDKAEPAKVPVKMKDEKQEAQECPVTMADEVAGPTCTIAVVDDEKDPTKSKATVTFAGLKEKEEAIPTWTGGTPTAELPNEVTVTKVKGAVTDLKVVFLIKDATVVEGAPELSCPGQVPALPEDEDPATPVYTIEATAEKEETTTVKVNALVTIDKEDKTKALPAGFKISWTRKGDGVSKLVVPEKKDEKSAGVGDTDTNGDEVKVDVAPVTEGEVATGETITENKVAEPYETCASLIDDKGASVAGPSCVTIPKAEEKKDQNPYNNPNPNQGTQPPPVFMFQPKNTATFGF